MAQMSAYELPNSLLVLFEKRQVREIGNFLVFQEDGCVKVETDHGGGILGMVINSVEGTPYGENIVQVVETSLAEEGIWGITTTSPRIYAHLNKIGVFEGSSESRSYRKGEKVYRALFG